MSPTRKLTSRKPIPPKVLIGWDSEWQFNPKTKGNDVLSYQAHLTNLETRSTHSFIHHIRPNWREKYERITLGEFLVRVLLSALKADVIASYPRSMMLAGHFTPRRPFHVLRFPLFFEAPSGRGSPYVCDHRQASSIQSAFPRRHASCDHRCYRHDVDRPAE
jgi:hypothetical protein